MSVQTPVMVIILFWLFRVTGGAGPHGT